MTKVLTEFPLLGNRVKLQVFKQQEIDMAYVSWLNDPEVVKYSNQRFNKHTAESCLKYLNSFEGTNNIFVGIRRSEDDVLIGTMTAYVSLVHGTVDVGIMIGDQSCKGKGYGQDAWNTMLNALSLSPLIRKITAGTLDCNLSMLKLMERSSMHLEAIRKKQEIVDGVAHDIHYYARFNEA